MSSWLPKDAWWMCVAPITGGSTNRSPELLERIIDQFNVETEPRYQRTAEGTKCNIFACDVTRALACEVPQRELINNQLVQQNANAMVEWFRGVRAIEQGWSEITMQVARARADAGFPVIACQRNPTGPGHIVVGRPAPATAAEDGVLWIAQAGGKNSKLMRVIEAFLPGIPVRYYFHN